MSVETAREELIEELDSDWNDYFGSGRLNNILDLTLSIVCVLASIAATVLATTDPKDISRWIVAIVAAIPAGTTSLQRIIGTRERSNWYFTQAAQVSALKTELRYASSPNLEDFAKKRAQIEVTMEGQWSKIGHSGVTPSIKRR